MKKTFIVLLMVLLSVMLVVSCKDSPKAEEVKEEKKIQYEDLIGTWQQGDDNDYIKIQFTADGKATMNEKSSYAATYDKNNMTVTLKDNVLTFTDNFGTYMYKVSFDGDKLVLTLELGSSSLCNYHTDQKYTMEKAN